MFNPECRINLLFATTAEGDYVAIRAETDEHTREVLERHSITLPKRGETVSPHACLGGILRFLGSHRYDGSVCETLSDRGHTCTIVVRERRTRIMQLATGGT